MIELPRGETKVYNETCKCQLVLRERGSCNGDAHYEYHLPFLARRPVSGVIGVAGPQVVGSERGYLSVR